MTYSAQTVENRSPSLLMGGVEPNDRQFRRAGHQLHCLVVDDNEYVLKFVAYLLTKIGFLKVDTAQMKPELMNKLATGSYDLLVTDFEMPDMNG